MDVDVRRRWLGRQPTADMGRSNGCYGVKRLWSMCGHMHPGEAKGKELDANDLLLGDVHEFL